MVENKSSKIIIKSISYLLLMACALVCIVPFIIILSSSFTTEAAINTYGYRVFIKEFSLDAYKMVAKSASSLISAYGVTIFVTIVGGLLSILVTMLAAYPLSRKDFKWKSQISFYFYFTMIFSGGQIPTYIIISRYLGLKNNVLVLILPMLVNVWNVFLTRTYLSNIPTAVIESSKIDGASEYKSFFSIVLPMAKTGIVTVFLMIVLAYWNDWYLCLMYMTNEKIITLQYFLYRTMSNIDAILKGNSSMAMTTDVSKLPSETARMAMCVLAAGPMIFIFIFFQKYFQKGITVGSVKG